MVIMLYVIQKSQKIYFQNGELIVLATDGNLYVKICRFSFSQNTISIAQNRSWYKSATTSTGAYNSSENAIYITKVIGYK